jgi:hypothetical protein
MTACLMAEYRNQTGFLLSLKQHSCERKYNTQAHAFVYHEEDSDYLSDFKGP